MYRYTHRVARYVHISVKKETAVGIARKTGDEGDETR